MLYTRIAQLNGRAIALPGCNERLLLLLLLLLLPSTSGGDGSQVQGSDRITAIVNNNNRASLAFHCVYRTTYVGIGSAWDVAQFVRIIAISQL